MTNSLIYTDNDYFCIKSTQFQFKANMINELKVAFRDVDWNAPQKSFTSIAQTLMGNYVVKKGNNRYAIIEIEFYLYSNHHKDYITYPRETQAVRWFFHQSGVDLTFESQDIKYEKEKHITTLGSNPRFGGILIRGLYKLNPAKGEQKYIFGPQKCVNELWDNFDAFHYSDEYPILSEATPEDNLNIDNLLPCKRCINIKDDNGLRDERIKEWGKRLGIEISDEERALYMNEMYVNPDTQLYRYFNLPNGEDPHTFTVIPDSSRPKK